jgi:hypothetical protein
MGVLISRLMMWGNPLWRLIEDGISRRAILILALIPALLFAVIGTGRSKPEPKPVPAPYIEQVHPADNFGDRFGATPIIEKRVRTIPIVKALAAIDPPVDPMPPEPVARAQEEESAPRIASRPRARVIRGVSLDLCARHGRRKVMVSRHRWRCLR